MRLDGVPDWFSASGRPAFVLADSTDVPVTMKRRDFSICKPLHTLGEAYAISFLVAACAPTNDYVIPTGGHP